MPETLTDEKRRAAVEKAAIAIYVASLLAFTELRARERWRYEPESIKDACRKQAEAALNAVDYFPLLEVAEAARGLILTKRTWYRQHPNASCLLCLDRPVSIEGALFGLEAALDRLAKSEEAKERG